MHVPSFIERKRDGEAGDGRDGVEVAGDPVPGQEDERAGEHRQNDRGRQEQHLEDEIQERHELSEQHNSRVGGQQNSEHVGQADGSHGSDRLSPGLLSPHWPARG